MDVTNKPEAPQVTRIRKLIDRFVEVHEKHCEARLQVLIFPDPKKTADCFSDPAGRRIMVEGLDDGGDNADISCPRYKLPLNGFKGFSKRAYLGNGRVSWEHETVYCFYFIVWDCPGSNEAERDLDELARQSGRIYQSLPFWIAPIEFVDSPQNLWLNVLYGHLHKTSFIRDYDGYESIEAPFSAGAEFWRRLLYGTKRNRTVQPGVILAKNEQRTVPPKLKRSRQDPREQRDRWIYQQSCKNITYIKIMQELQNLAPKKDWVAVTTPQGIRQIAAKYADRNSLPRPSRRQDY